MSRDQWESLGPEPIARGGQAEVWKVQHYETGVVGALKQAIERRDHEDDLTPSTTLRCVRLQRELKAVRDLKHPALATLLDAGPSWIVFKFIDGRTLAEEIALGPMPHDRVVRIAREIAEPLAEMHQRGLVHRDLKPSNVMLENGRTIRLIDLGLARDITGPEDLTRDAFCGTPRYADPNALVQGSRKASASEDVYSLAVVCWTLLHGEPPWDRPGPNGLPPVEVECPEWFRELLHECTTKRLKDASEFMARLPSERQSLEPTVTATIISPPSRDLRKWLPVVATGAAACVFGVVFATLMRAPAPTITPLAPAPTQITVSPAITQSPTITVSVVQPTPTRAPIVRAPSSASQVPVKQVPTQSECEALAGAGKLTEAEKCFEMREAH